MTYEEILEAILSELSLILQSSVDSVRAKLKADGDQWPCDSLLLTEAVVALEASVGIHLPMDARTAKSLKSVKGLAVYIHELTQAEASVG